MNDIEKLANNIGTFEFRPGYRGIPAGLGLVSSSSVAGAHWRPADGLMNLPLLSMDLAAYEANKTTMIGICRKHDCQIAPHIKTPMSPVIARDLVASGAWGISVADLRQMEVMLEHGVQKLIIANQIGGMAAVRRLSTILRSYPRSVDIYMFVDSVSVVNALAKVWSDDATLPPLNVLVEVGCGRGGVSTDAEVSELIAAILSAGSDRLPLSGIAAYEGTANRPDEVQLMANLSDLFNRVSSAMALARAAVGKGKPLLLSMGGSSLFDHVITQCGRILQNDGEATLLLRSGACFFSDHGPIRARLQTMAERNLLGSDTSALIAGSFAPVLRIWSEVLSLNGAHDAICGFGLRDVAHDQGLPIPVALWRDGIRTFDLAGCAEVVKLNDQHAFVKFNNADVEVGDVVEFGVKHPCTSIDKHDLLFGLDSSGEVSVVLRTFFG